MAESDVKFTVVADTGAAKRELSDLERAAARVQSAANRGGGGGGGGNTPRPDGEGEEFGKSAGKQIGKALAGFMAREASGIIFNELRRRGIGGDNLDIAQAAFGGAMAFGTTGAMLAGPWGAVIGGGIGAAAGGFKAWQENEEVKREQIEALEDDPRKSNQSLAAWTQQNAMMRMIQLTPLNQRYTQIQMLQEETAKRSDHFRKALEMAIEMGSKLPPALRKEAEEQYNLSSGLTRQLNQASMATLMEMIKPITPPDIATDAFAKRGLYAGATVSPDVYQQSISQSVDQAVQLLRQILEASRASGANVNSLTSVGINAAYFGK